MSKSNQSTKIRLRFAPVGDVQGSSTNPHLDIKKAHTLLLCSRFFQVKRTRLNSRCCTQTNSIIWLFLTTKSIYSKPLRTLQSPTGARVYLVKRHKNKFAETISRSCIFQALWSTISNSCCELRMPFFWLQGKSNIFHCTIVTWKSRFSIQWFPK